MIFKVVKISDGAMNGNKCIRLKGLLLRQLILLAVSLQLVLMNVLVSTAKLIRGSAISKSSGVGKMLVFLLKVLADVCGGRMTKLPSGRPKIKRNIIACYMKQKCNYTRSKEHQFLKVSLSTKDQV